MSTPAACLPAAKAPCLVLRLAADTCHGNHRGPLDTPASDPCAPALNPYAPIATAQCTILDKSPEDHLAINLRAALVKAREYYNKLDLSPAYYTATILHPRYKSYLDAAWADKPDWLESSNRNFQRLWAEYKSLPKPRLRPKVRHNDIDDAINSFIKLVGLTENEEDKYKAWKRSEPIASEGVDPIKY
ncbi:hypothetical protein L13192_09503 [Pyrenophora tritici-repentis]|nr:hypothetical protein L13192_09503 [Pyrenophora tritici-repentis]